MKIAPRLRTTALPLLASQFLMLVGMAWGATFLAPGAQGAEPVAGPARVSPGGAVQPPRTLPRTQKAVVPLVIEEKAVGTLLILIEAPPSRRILCQASPILLGLETSVRPDVLKALTARVDAAGFLSIDSARACADTSSPACELEISFDPQQVLVSIRIPSHLRERQQVDLNTLDLPEEAASALRSAAFSGFLNVRSSLGATWSEDPLQAAQSGERILDLDGALNLYGWVLEGSGTGTAMGTEELLPSFAWAQNSLRLVRDDPGHALRYSVGDLTTPVTGLLGSLSLTGLGVSRNYSLQPYRQIRPISQFEFFLEQDSRVDVYSNGSLLRTLQLQAGPHDLRTLPLNVGVSDVQLEITDILGRRQRLDFNTAMAIEQLAPGIDQFVFSVGVPQVSLFALDAAAFESPALVLQYDRGFTQLLTAGGFFYGDFQTQSAGVSAILSTLTGNVSIETAASRSISEGTGSALKLGYQYTRSRRQGIPWNLALAASINSPQFKRSGTQARDDRFAYAVSGTQSVMLPGELRASTTWHYGQGHESQPSEFALNIGLSKSFSNGIGLYLNGNLTRDSIGKNERSAWLNLWWVVPHRRISSLSSSNGVTMQGWAGSQVSWQESALKPTGGLATSVTVSDDPEALAAAARVGYTGYHGFLEGSYEASRGWEDEERIPQGARLSGGTTLVMADGRFGLSRPVTDSFALIAPVKALRGKTIGVNSGPHGPEARADILGPATLPALTPYRVSMVRLDPSRLPAGFSLGEEVYPVMPGYRSGVLVTAGRDATVYLRGVLVYQDNSPVQLRAAEIHSLKDKNWKPLPFFTNRAGRFALDGLRPGRYQMKIGGVSGEHVEFEIPSKTEGVYDLGTLKLKGLPPSER